LYKLWSQKLESYFCHLTNLLLLYFTELLIIIISLFDYCVVFEVAVRWPVCISSALFFRLYPVLREVLHVLKSLYVEITLFRQVCILQNSLREMNV